MRLTPTIVLTLSLATATAPGEVIDTASTPAAPLERFVGSFDAAGVDVLYDHDSESGVAGPSFGDRPRIAPLIGFKTWSSDDLDLDAHAAWLEAFETGARGAIAAAPTDGDDTRPSRKAFERIWKDADDGERIVITFDAADKDVAERIAGALEDQGYAVYLAIAAPDREPLDPKLLGVLFVESDHVLVIDTATARMNDVIQFEADLLAELRRQTAWVESDDDGLPPIKRGSLDVIEAMGVLPMEVMPGGILLGLPAQIAHLGSDARYAHDGSDYGIAIGGTLHSLEQVSDETREAIEALVAIEDSHSVVDIAGGEVTLADPLQGTRIGSRMARADRLPFGLLSVNGAQKSLIVDDGIVIRRDGDDLAVDVALQIRFYRADEEDRAVRIASLAFTVADATGSARLRELTWKREADRRIAFDGCGTEELIDRLEQCALDAALIGIARIQAD